MSMTTTLSAGTFPASTAATLDASCASKRRLHPQAAQLVDRDEALELGGLRVAQRVLLHLDDGLADEDAVARLQRRRPCTAAR